MNERDWLIIVILYEQKNITRTASKLFLSQPTLTTRIKYIEDYFKTPLIIRTAHGVQFTPAGEMLALKAHEMLHTFEDIRTIVRTNGGKIAGILRIAATNYFTIQALPRLLSRFKQLHPDVEFEIITGVNAHIQSLAKALDVHVGFVSSDACWQHEKRLLFEETVVAASTTQFELRNLPEMPRINYKCQPELRDAVDNWWYENFSTAARICMEVDSADICYEMLINGLGYAILPSACIKPNDSLYQTALTHTSGEPLKRYRWMIFHDSVCQNRLVETFIEFAMRTEFVTLQLATDH